MSDQYWLTEAQLKRIEPIFPGTRGIPRVDDRRVVSGITHVIRNGLRWRDAPAINGTFVRWSRMGIFDQIFASLAAESGPPDRVMIDDSATGHVRKAAGLAAYHNALRPLCLHILQRYLHRANRYLLTRSMSPDPGLVLERSAWHAITHGL
jgi:putative transposase